MAEADTEGESASQRDESKLYMGQHGPSVWREGMQIGNPMSEGLSACAISYFPFSSRIQRTKWPSLLIPKVTDFKPIPYLFRHTLKEILHCNAEDHPILVTEPAWNTPANRERMAEIMFEEFQVPAFYIANTGVLNAFVMKLSSCWNCL